ncbi:hypothetical protein SAMN05216196_105274 [Lutimaribacter pacificus]|uniref:26 kDa periplasmic immunogenic protein n=1 Tax=Lutimaribacter pacificus TaxID=391948 RepID=A0A1H0JGZ8_9RHOB|nr:SIMPL domain-containing protein [Lutimaribacter pacificus]SDO42852.1 hypothetical protein SAMN05216196_105274 [Lutimaribacter pacificus]SHK10387.1 hypothetical protein SAMN05444142_103266 [Lutimaribacter pacificus]
MRNILICALLTLAPATAWAEDAARVLTVTGTGEVARAPDMAVIRVGVVEQDKSAEVALSRASEAMTRMQAQLAGQGIEPRDIQTTQLSLNPVYENSSGTRTRRVVGFEAMNSVLVRVRDLPSTGAVLGALVGDGANRIDGISFTLQDGEEAMDEARRRAVADARRKAELLAEAAGVGLGEVRDIREAGGGMPRPVMMERMAADVAAVPIAEGEVSLSATVSMVYELN